ncbi:relaxase/mobilization nuclease domain-containing protein [Xanthomonas hortorum]|uniref:MobA/VirD2-like nuclease domain-containing protein n=1 Tax=Xanthomonas hortorum TaxID=56454 RepID=A0AA47IDY5_9XANT|nr:hypothetical protein [Xanthomonas hortorum]WAH66887.1 hypothetical protein OEG85_24280 [Xanthomonas hortorum]
MIVKSSARSGGKALAAHLTNPEENERISITGSQGVTSDDVYEAIAEMEGMSAGWSGSKPLFHAHISPDQAMSKKDWSAAWAEYEKEFGLEGRPYVEVEHLKDGRLPHRHRAYLRVDTETHRANDVWRSKVRDEKISRLLEHELGHKLTHGPHDFQVMKRLQEEGRHDVAKWIEGRPIEIGRATNWDEHQQAKRTKVDKQDVREDMAAAWQSGDSGNAVAAALEARGYVVARGDKRDVVLIDVAGGVHSPARLLKQAGIDTRAKAIRERFADLKDLPTVSQAQAMQGQHRQAQIDHAASNIERPTLPQASAKRAERAQVTAKAREERRAAWIAERKAEYAAAKDAVLQAYRDEKANRREICGHMWKAEQQRRAGEREALKSSLSAGRKRIYSLVGRGLLRMLALAAHNLKADREWASLKKRQAQRWGQTKTVHPVPKWQDFVQYRAAAGDVHAQLLVKVRGAGRKDRAEQPARNVEARRPVRVRPGVGPIGRNPPPMSRGRLRTLADVQHLSPVERPVAVPAVDPLSGFRASVERAEAAGGGLALDVAKAQFAVAQEFQASGKDPRHYGDAIMQEGQQRVFAKLREQPAEAQQTPAERTESEQDRKRREVLERYRAKMARDKDNERGGRDR